MLPLQFAAYTAALWLACYLLARRPLTRSLTYTGLGLVAYAGALAITILLGALVPTPPAPFPTPGGTLDTPTPMWLAWLVSIQWPLFIAPALCWSLALGQLTPEAALPARWRARLEYAVAAIAAVALVASVLAALGLFHRLVAVIASAALLTLVLTVVFVLLRAGQYIPIARARTLTLLSSLFFGLGAGLLLLPLPAPVPWLPREWLVLAVGLDLLVFGWVVAALDAFAAGERLRADFVRSLLVALALVAAFGGQVSLALALGAGPRAALTAVLLGVTACSVAIPSFAEPLQRTLDTLVFGRPSAAAESRAALREAAGTLSRQPAAADPLALPDDEFIAVTRRALSHFGDLPKLAGSPLIYLPAVDHRLAARGAPGDVLERAAELKALLAESIARLKPPDRRDFATTDEWRHYNAIYFPYVLGLKPYSRRAPPVSPGAHRTPERDVAAAAALDWFRTQVPERTLFNWQRAAARLIALDLRERSLTAASDAPAPGPSGPRPAPHAPPLPETNDMAAAGSTLRSHGSG